MAEIQAKAFEAATIGLKKHKSAIRFKKNISGWRRALIQVLLPDRFYKNIEKRAREYLEDAP